MLPSSFCSLYSLLCRRSLCAAQTFLAKLLFSLCVCIYCIIFSWSYIAHCACYRLRPSSVSVQHARNRGDLGQFRILAQARAGRATLCMWRTIHEFKYYHEFDITIFLAFASLADIQGAKKASSGDEVICRLPSTRASFFTIPSIDLPRHGVCANACWWRARNAHRAKHPVLDGYRETGSTGARSQPAKLRGAGIQGWAIQQRSSAR